MARPETVDSVVPRAKALFHALIPAVAYVIGYPVGAYILAITGIIMAASVLGGPRYSLFGRIFKAVRPALKIGPGKPENVAPHRFSEAMGAAGLLIAAALYFLGAHGLAEIVTLVIVALAFLNAAAGICVGCQMYTLIKRTSKSAVA
jgi:uncharacterized protein DUF4395